MTPQLKALTVKANKPEFNLKGSYYEKSKEKKANRLLQGTI